MQKEIKQKPIKKLKEEVVDDTKLSLVERIARKSILISMKLDKNPNSVRLAGALSLLIHAHLMTGKNDGLAIRLFNQASRLGRGP